MLRVANARALTRCPACATVLQLRQMSNTLTVRLPNELLNRLRQVARRTGLPVGRVVRQSLEKTLAPEVEQPWKKYVGILKDGPPNLSSRKGFSRK
jgi:predicted DNA-binding protein